MHTVDDHEVTYTVFDRIFGPVVTEHDMFCLEVRAFTEGWSEWYHMILAVKKGRNRRWLLAYLRDNVIGVTVREEFEDPYEDDDPWEGMG